MAFFGLTALGPQNSFASSSRQRRNLQIFEDSDFVSSWESINGRNASSCRIAVINDIMRTLFRGPVPPNDKFYIDQKFQDISLATGLLTIGFEDYMIAMRELRDDAFHEEETFKGKIKPTCEFTSSKAFKDSMIRHSRMKQDAPSKLALPLTASQEYGWQKTELQIPRAGKKMNEITKYADELVKNFCKMRLTENIVDSLNNTLDDLAIEGTYRFQLEQFTSDTPIDGFNETISLILSKLKNYDLTLQDIHADSSVFDIFSCLGTRKPPFQANSQYVCFKLLHFLAINLQGERISFKGKLDLEESQPQTTSTNSLTRNEIAGKRGKILFQLEKICEDLNFDIDQQTNSMEIEGEGREEEDDGEENDDPDQELNELMVLKAIRTHLEQLLSPLSSLERQFLSHPPPLLEGLSFSLSSLSPSQLNTLREIETLYYQDFSLRLSLLLKRLDVTLKAFSWGKKISSSSSSSSSSLSSTTVGGGTGGAEGGTGAGGVREQFISAVRAQREKMEASVQKYTVEDALLAPRSLLLQFTRKTHPYSPSPSQRRGEIMSTGVGSGSKESPSSPSTLYPPHLSALSHLLSQLKDSSQSTSSSPSEGGGVGVGGGGMRGRVGGHRRKTGGESLVKRVIIGAVPDRGGRADQMRPSKSDINPFGKGRGGGGGGGGGRGGRGGRGGGGGDRKRGFDNNNHNNNNNNNHDHLKSKPKSPNPES